MGQSVELYVLCSKDKQSNSLNLPFTVELWKSVISLAA